MAFIKLRGVTRNVRLPDDSMLHILKGVDLDVNLGEHISIVGRSGTGKSTLLNILGLLDSPSAGSYEFDGRHVEKASNGALTKLRGRDVGFVFQQFNLLSGRTALDNVAAPLIYSSGRTFWRRRSLAADMLGRLGLADRLESFPEQLSGGEQQRVAIARALVRRPRLILADEPTGALDLETGREIMSVLDGAAKEDGAALITITHDQQLAKVASIQYLLQRGKLWRKKDPEVVSLQPAPDASGASAQVSGESSAQPDASAEAVTA